MRILSLWLPLLASAAATVHVSALTIQNPRFTISSSDATQLQSEQLTLDATTLPSLSLGPTDTLKLTFQVVDRDGGKGVQPHQTFLRFASAGEEGLQPVRVTAGGKAKFELNMSKLPTSFPPTSTDPVTVQLLLGSFKHDPAKLDLFELIVPASAAAPQHPDEVSFHPLPPIAHTFRAEQKVPPKFVSAVFSVLITAPWAVLLGMWSTLNYRTPHLFSPYVIPFASSLAAFEGLLLWYWIDLKLGQVLLYGALLSLVTVITGKQALGAAGDWRLHKK